MAGPGEWPRSPFWDHSLAVYARAGVAEASLGLQDRHGLDVNILLWCCWAAASGRRLDGAAIARALAAVGDWHTRVVRPLRTVRRRLKSVAGAASDELAALLRSRVAAAELDAEHIEQLTLEAVAPEPRHGADDLTAAVANLSGYAHAAGIVWSDRDVDDLAALLDGVFPEAGAAAARRFAEELRAGPPPRPTLGREGGVR